jgi:hypothetical protein
MTKGVEPKCAGLGGVNDDNLNANETNFKSSGVHSRVWRDELRGKNPKKIIAVDNEDQETGPREQGNEQRHNPQLCPTPSIESGVVVVLERAGLPPDAFANVSSYGANVEVAHTAVILALMATLFLCVTSCL